MEVCGGNYQLFFIFILTCPLILVRLITDFPNFPELWLDLAELN